VLIARSLGVEEYGAFVGVVALVAILSPFAPMGWGQILIRNVARDRDTFCASWGNALFATGLCGSALSILLVFTSRSILAHKVPYLLVLLIAASDLLLAPIVGLAAQAFQAIEELHRTAQLYTVLTGMRAGFALVLFVLSRHPQALTWAFFYCLSSVIAGAHAISLVGTKLGRPKVSLAELRSELRDGLYFAIGLSSQSIYNDIDKTMLVRLGSFGAAGIYAVAYRMIDLSFQPAGALLSSAYPRFFRYGERGLSGVTELSRRLLPIVLIYTAIAGSALFLLAPAIPLVFGKDYGASVAALRWLCPIGLFRAIHYVLSYALTGANLQGVRSAIQVCVAGLNVLLNLWLIPAFSWRGAAWASVASDGALALGIFAAVAVLHRKQVRVMGVCRVEPTVTS